MILFISAFLTLNSPQGASARNDPGTGERALSEKQEKAKPRIEISLYLKNVRSFDLDNGDFTADFWLIQECDRPCAINDDFVIQNGWADSVELVDRHENRQTYNIRASLISDHDVRHYPFDSHKLPVVIRFSEDYAAEYAPGMKSGFGPDLFIPGFELSPFTETEIVKSRNQAMDEMQSLFRFSVEGHRILQASLMRLLPPLLFVLVGLACVMIRPDISLLSGVLLGSVFYQIFLNEHVPPISRLTFAEIFMSINYLTLALCIILSLGLGRYVTGETHKRLLFISTRALPLGWFLLQGVNVVFLLHSLYVEHA